MPVFFQDARTAGPLLGFSLQPGDDLRCDVYFVPLSLASTEPPLPPDVRVYNLVCPTTGANRTEFIPDTSLFANPPSEGYAGCTANTEATFEHSIQAATGLGRPIQTRNTDVNGLAFFPEVPSDEYYTLVQAGTGAEHDFRHGNDTTYISVVNYVAQGSDEETPTADTVAVPATATVHPTPTPEPGRPAVIVAGSCAVIPDNPDAVVADLTDLREPEGERVGQEDVALPETAFTTVPLSFDDLLDDDRAIVVFPEEDGVADEPVACGNLGGVLNSNGTLLVGLQEMDESDLSGIAVLSPNASGSDRTDVSLFLVDGLAADDGTATPA